MHKKKINKYICIYIYNFRRNPITDETRESQSKFAGGEGWCQEGEAAGQVPLEPPAEGPAPGHPVVGALAPQ